MMIEGDSNWKSYGLNKKQADYCKAYIETGVKRKAYSIAYGVEGGKQCDDGIYRLETKYGKELCAYMKHLFDLLEEECVAHMSQLQKYWLDVMYSDDFDSRSKLKASELLAKSIGGFIDRQEIDAKVETVVFTGEDDILE